MPPNPFGRKSVFEMVANPLAAPRPERATSSSGPSERGRGASGAGGVQALVGRFASRASAFQGFTMELPEAEAGAEEVSAALGARSFGATWFWPRRREDKAPVLVHIGSAGLTGGARPPQEEEGEGDALGVTPPLTSSSEPEEDLDASSAPASPASEPEPEDNLGVGLGSPSETDTEISPAEEEEEADEVAPMAPPKPRTLAELRKGKGLFRASMKVDMALPMRVPDARNELMELANRVKAKNRQKHAKRGSMLFHDD